MKHSFIWIRRKVISCARAAQQVNCGGAAAVWCALLGKPGLCSEWHSPEGGTRADLRPVIRWLGREKNTLIEGENRRGRVRTPPTSDLLLSAIQSVFYLHRRGRKTGRIGKQSIQEKKGWDVKRVLVHSVHPGSSSSVHKRRSDWEEEIATKKWENLDIGRKYGAGCNTEGYKCRLQEHYGGKDRERVM